MVSSVVATRPGPSRATVGVRNRETIKLITGPTGPITTPFRMHRDRDAKCTEREEGNMGRGIHSSSNYRGLGERRKLPQRGPGRSSRPKNGFYAYVRSEKSHLEAISVSDGGAPERRGARENFSPFAPLDRLCQGRIRIKIYN